jgi:hypothetical protein
MASAPTTWPLFTRTDEELLIEYGNVMWAATQAFALDVGYLTAMVLVAGRIEYKRALYGVKKEIRREHPDADPALHTKLVQERLSELGIEPPPLPNGAKPRSKWHKREFVDDEELEDEW